MDNIKITADGFVWLIVTDSAKELWSSGALPIYELFDESEAQILTREHLDKALEWGNEIGVEIAPLQTLINSYQYQQSTRQHNGNY
jgi:hypothetical protein